MATPARFVRGSNKLDLDNLTYYLGEDFTPPAPAREYNFASGTSLNRTGGASLVGTRAMNRPLEFTVNVRGTNEAANISAARRLISFIMAGDGLYFEWQEFPGLPEPLWGQLGAWMRYEVVTATAQLNGLFGSMGRTANVQVEVSLQVKPFALGNKQRLINAAGYVFENNYGSATGEALGLSIHEATTNKMTNPVLGHATFGNGWTAGSSTIVTKNTDTALTLPGILQSAKVISLASTNNTYTQSIAAGNTNKHSFSAYVFLPDGGAPTTADFDIYYGAAKATTYQSLGNGLYLAYSDNIDGIAAATTTGIVVKSGRTVYLCGFQMEEKAYHTPLAYGDLLGCAWTSTAHASTSTRTVSTLIAANGGDMLSFAEGAVSIVWKPYYSSTFGTSSLLFFFSNSSLRISYEEFNDNFVLRDGTNAVATAAQTFSAGDTLYLTATWGPGGLNIYKNGVNAATGTTYTPPAAADSANLQIGGAGTSYTANGSILSFDIYDTELTTTQALALYTAQAAIVAGGKRVSSIPWLWTKDGDGVVDNCNDATRDNFCVVGGVPGSEDAVTDIDMKLSEITGNLHSIALSKIEADDFFDPIYLYVETGATADAGSSGGFYEEVLLGNGDSINYSALNVSSKNIKRLVGRHLTPYTRSKNATGFLSVRSWVGFGSLGTIYTDYKRMSFGTPSSFQFLESGSITIPDASNAIYGNPNKGIEIDCAVGIHIRRDTSGSANALTDFVQMMPRPMIKIVFPEAAATGEDGLFISQSGTFNYDLTTLKVATAGITTRGDIIEMSPRKYNTLIHVLGDNVAWSTAVITQTGAYKIHVTPRWSLL